MSQASCPVPCGSLSLAVSRDSTAFAWRMHDLRGGWHLSGAGPARGALSEEEELWGWFHVCFLGGCHVLGLAQGPHFIGPFFFAE